MPSTVDISTRYSKNEALLTQLESDFNAAISSFEQLVLNPGTGFDVDSWLDQVPAPTIEYNTYTPITAPNTNAHGFGVAQPSLLNATDAWAAALGDYDSAYLEYMEQQIRTITADVLDSVLPTAARDSYFKIDRLKKARLAVDEIDAFLANESARGFPVIPMEVAKGAVDILGKWMDVEHAHQEKTTLDKLELSEKIYFATIQHGIEIEALRAKIILAYYDFYRQQHGVLVGYYKQQLDQKVAQARLALEDEESDFQQMKVNQRLELLENESEVLLPREVFRRAVERLKLEIKVDEELVERRFKSLASICSTYADWASGVLSNTQGMAVNRHNHEAT